MSESHEEYKARLTAAQTNKTKDEIMEDLSSQSEYAVDLENLPRQSHNWVKRGIKVSCEGAGHPHHSHFLVRR